MFLHDIELRTFRCFDKKNIQLKKQVTVITGNNGAGKTTLTEAIYYLCYLKSFRSHVVSELIMHDYNSFFLKGTFSTNIDFENKHTLQIGYLDKKKSVKIDNASISNYKEIFDVFQVVTILEDDINLIKGYPQNRRAFIDQACLFLLPNYIDTYRNFRKILQNRNTLLERGYTDKLELQVWTEQLWSISFELQQQRKSVLKHIQDIVNNLLCEFFDDIYQVSLDYQSKLTYDNFNQFIELKSSMLQQEIMFKRSLFGAHLDDISIHIKHKKAREFASRGQQKLVSLLCKLSLIKMAKNNDFSPILLIDDFIADFDQKRLEQIANFFNSCKNQIIITTPIYDKNLQEILQSLDPDVISVNSLL